MKHIHSNSHSHSLKQRYKVHICTQGYVRTLIPKETLAYIGCVCVCVRASTRKALARTPKKKRITNIKIKVTQNANPSWHTQPSGSQQEPSMERDIAMVMAMLGTRHIRPHFHPFSTIAPLLRCPIPHQRSHCPAVMCSPAYRPVSVPDPTRAVIHHYTPTVRLFVLLRSLFISLCVRVCVFVKLCERLL